MSDPSRQLERLDKELLALGEEAMLIEEFDGFVAGVLVCPELIKPHEWLPVVWGRPENDSQAVFEDLDHANRVLQLIMAHYNDVAGTLIECPDRYDPLLPVDERNGDVLWEIWIEGFEKAVKLRPKAWQKLSIADIDTATAMHGMRTLIDVAAGNRELSRAERDALNAAAPDNIARWIPALNAWRLANYRPPLAPDAMRHAAFAATGKVGRNEPCPCGSGK
jgi:uncharacterized protein